MINNEYSTIISNIQKYLGKGSGCIINSVIDHINISKYNLLTGSSYIKLPKELNHSKKRLIDVQNFDNNECFKWCLVRYLNPADHHPERIRKIDKLFGHELVFEDIKFSVRIKDIHKIDHALFTKLVILYIAEKDIFVVVIYKLLAQKKY